jgi:hypothetical protein
MAQQQDREDTKQDKQNADAPLKPDPETLGTTDPQEHMKGPISSLMQKVKDGAEENDKEDNKKLEKGEK